MKTAQRLFVTALGVLVPALLVPTGSSAQCLGSFGARAAHTSFFLQPGQIRLLPAALLVDDDANGNDPSIVGFWHDKLVSRGTKNVPDGTVLETGLTQWHSDHTEIDNNGSVPPISGNLCLGVWEQTGRYTYKLNHFPLPWDASGSTFLGPIQYWAEVTLNPKGTEYSGRFTLDQYDPTGKTLLSHAQGIVTATRITVDSTPEQIF